MEIALWVGLGLIVVVGIVLEVLAQRHHDSIKDEVKAFEGRVTSLLNWHHGSVVDKIAAPALVQQIAQNAAQQIVAAMPASAPVPPDPFKARSAEGGTFGKFGSSPGDTLDANAVTADGRKMSDVWAAAQKAADDAAAEQIRLNEAYAAANGLTYDPATNTYTKAAP